MWTLTGWLIALTVLGLAIGLAQRYWRNTQSPPEKNDVAQPPSQIPLKQMPTPSKPLERERLEQWIYTQWEQKIGERLERWIYPDPAQQLQQEWIQVQRVREQLERERQAWEQQKQQQEHGQQESQTTPPQSDQVDPAYLRANWHHILGLVSTTASAEEIKRAYHKRISEYHPDKVSQMGGKIQELAKVESQKINAAYEYARTQGRV